MRSINFPTKVIARQQRALARLKGPSDPTSENYAVAMVRFVQEKESLQQAINSVAGNPRNLRSKKDRRDRAKVG